MVTYKSRTNRVPRNRRSAVKRLQRRQKRPVTRAITSVNRKVKDLQTLRELKPLNLQEAPAVANSIIVPLLDDFNIPAITGRKAVSTSLSLRVRMLVSDFTANRPYEPIRMLVFWDTEAQDNVTPEEVLGTDGTPVNNLWSVQPYKRSNMKRFRILYDRIHTLGRLPIGVEGGAITWTGSIPKIVGMKIKTRRTIMKQPTATDELQTNKPWLMMLTDGTQLQLNITLNSTLNVFDY